MEIIDFFESSQKERWIDKIDYCDWNAAKLLAKLLRDAQEFNKIKVV